MKDQMKNRKHLRMPDKKPSDRPRIFSLNVGTAVFGILFIYILATIVMFVTARHVTSYQVTSGPLAKNETYTGVALYDEQIVRADASGYVNYYAGNNTKVRSGGIVYGISPEKQETADIEPGEETLKKIRSELEAFARNYSPDDFNDVYSLKYLIAGDILNETLENSVIADTTGSMTIGSETVNMASADGIVTYSTDGYESIDYRNLPEDFFDENSYSVTYLKTNSRVDAGDSVYRLIRSEEWSLIIPLTSKQIVRLSDLTTIRVKFLKDGVTQNASFSILTQADGTYCGKLDFSSGLIRYLDNRFIDIELVTNTEVGLKIPVTAIVNKEFFTIPDEYASQEEDSSAVGFRRLTTDKLGNITIEFLTTTLYEHKDGKYYVDDSVFSAGDVIVREGSRTDRYIIKDTQELEGVYSMNKGYAVFRKVSIITKNEEYCLVEKGTSFGIAQFDNIVADASTVKESQITAK